MIANAKGKERNVLPGAKLVTKCKGLNDFQVKMQDRSCSITVLKLLNYAIWAKPPAELMKVFHLKCFRTGKSPSRFRMQFKEELDRLVDKGPLIPVTEQSERVSQMAVVHKPNGKLPYALIVKV